MAAPLFYSGDMSKLDPFTLNVLCNPEVIEVNQDPLGQSAPVTRISEETFIMIKDMEDGSKAAGLFNQGEFPAEMTLTWGLAALNGPVKVRDLWRQTDRGTFDREFRVTVPRRGCVMVRLTPVKPGRP
jgi:alpha-galactosidase